MLISATLVGGALVALGIIWEEWRAGHLWSVTTMLVILGVVIEAGATIVLFEFDEGISNALTRENGKLEKILLPRRLLPDGYNERQRFAASHFPLLKGLGEVPAYIQSISDAEADALADDMHVMLGRSGWAPHNVGGRTISLQFDRFRAPV